jgi:hypothetical protein
MESVLPSGSGIVNVHGADGVFADHGLWLSSLRSVRRLAATRYGGPRGAAWAAWALSFAARASAKWTAAMIAWIALGS